MYFIFVALFLFVLPAISVLVEAVLRSGSADLMLLVGKWFVFWGVGVRLFIAGLRQVAQPRFTAESIFQVKDRGALSIVREVGFANLAMGALGLLTLAEPNFLVSAAIVGGLYYGLAGAGHAVRGNKNASEWTALVSDLFMFFLLAAFLGARVF
ncbi:MAG: DUF6790 family protein [Xanthobacteraceae bacterium]|jgi:hypothetical protein